MHGANVRGDAGILLSRLRGGGAWSVDRAVCNRPRAAFEPVNVIRGTSPISAGGMHGPDVRCCDAETFEAIVAVVVAAVLACEIGASGAA